MIFALLDTPLNYAGFSLIVWTGLFLGILHSIIPCNDKVVFCFYAFGVARDWKQAFRIINYYGAGLFLMNFIIGGVISYFGAIFGSLVNIENYRFLWNAISSSVLIISGTIMLIQLRKKTYWPHSDQFQELTESLPTLRTRKRTAFLLGLLAGIPPCIFETAVYLQAISISVGYGWGNGTWLVFFFGIGTWLGLYPLALVGTASGRISKALQGSTLQKIQLMLKKANKGVSYALKDEDEKTLDLELGESKAKALSKLSTSSKIEYFSAVIMIFFGLLFLLLAIFNVEIIPPENIPTNVPWPFPN
ncbi:MAG: urease accessory protein UreH domain-containing protein [Promethearchaeota archaeon]